MAIKVLLHKRIDLREILNMPTAALEMIADVEIGCFRVLCYPECSDVRIECDTEEEAKGLALEAIKSELKRRKEDKESPPTMAPAIPLTPTAVEEISRVLREAGRPLTVPVIVSKLDPEGVPVGLVRTRYNSERVRSVLYRHRATFKRAGVGLFTLA